jgi:hypothetical protein
MFSDSRIVVVDRHALNKILKDCNHLMGRPVMESGWIVGAISEMRLWLDMSIGRGRVGIIIG